MGSWRVSKTDDIAYPTVKFNKNNNIKIKLPKYEINRLDVKDEYDRTAICHILEEHKQVMIKANTPGCGKSYICEGMVDLGHNVIVICPTNKLVQQYEAANDKITSITINKLLNIKMGEQTEKKTPFNYYEFDGFVFDEIYFNDIQVLNRIKRFIDTNNYKQNYSNGRQRTIKTSK
jgi:superfamily II DNA or RNA helicase